MIVGQDDLDFDARSKNYAVEQTRYDLLKQQTGSVKGVIRNSGLTAGQTGNPLRAYLTIVVGPNSDTVNIYSGVAYDEYEGRANRIWVPDDPTDVPATSAAAITNYDNVDMPDETQYNDFTPTTRPARTNLKTFDVADAADTYYVCIRFVTGTYDPITIPSDGQQENAKRYDSYEIRVSTDDAAACNTNYPGYTWVQLAHLYWNGSSIESLDDDRVFASCTTSLEDELITQHQKLYHDSGIIADVTTNKLQCTIDNSAVPNPAVLIANRTFTTGEEGMNIDGDFVDSEVTPEKVEFTVSDAAGTYYIYVNQSAVAMKTTTYATAYRNLPLCYVTWNGLDTITGVWWDPTNTPNDTRQFGTIGEGQLSNLVLGNGWNLSDMTIEELSDELQTHRDNQHGNGLFADLNNNLPYTAGSGGLGATVVGNIITIADLGMWDRLYVYGQECTTRHPGWSNTFDLTGDADDTYVVYASATRGSDGYYSLSYHSASWPESNTNYPICSVNVVGGAVDAASLEDIRVYNTVGYAHIQRDRNPSGLNVLPQLMVYMRGYTPSLAHGVDSGWIYLTDDYGAGNCGGGTATGNMLYAAFPNIQVYVYTGGAYCWLWDNIEIENLNLANMRFRINNNTGSTHAFYWVAIGIPVANYSQPLHGEDNPTYDH